MFLSISSMTQFMQMGEDRRDDSLQETPLMYE